MVTDATGEYLSEFDLRTYSDFGGSRAYISKQELAELKRCGTTSEPGLFLLGFKPLDALRPHHNIHSPYFIYPDEDLVEGSTAAFAALHKASSISACSRWCVSRGPQARRHASQRSWPSAVSGVTMGVNMSCRRVCTWCSCPLRMKFATPRAA